MADKPVISFEALTFFSATLAVMLEIVSSTYDPYVYFQDNSDNNVKAYANFFIGTSLAIFLLMLGFRALLGTAVLRGDVGVPKNIEMFCLCLAFFFAVLAVMTIVVSIHKISGVFVWVSGTVAAVVIGYANTVKYKEVTDVQIPIKSEALVVVPQANTRENARRQNHADDIQFRRVI